MSERITLPITLTHDQWGKLVEAVTQYQDEGSEPYPERSQLLQATESIVVKVWDTWESNRVTKKQVDDFIAQMHADIASMVKGGR